MRRSVRDGFVYRGNIDCYRRAAGEWLASRVATARRRRPQLLEKISNLTGTPVDASQITASWQTFGPTLDARDIHVGLKDGGTMAVKRVTLALDVWQSLLHMRWQFRDLTFWQLQVHTNTPIQTNDGGESLKTDRISDLFLRQFDHFTLRDSHLSFLTLSGQRAELAVPQLTWLNGRNRHRAEGQLSLSSLTGQHGVMQVRMDLRDEDGLLNKGRVWLQADDIDVKPWLGRWMQDNIALKSARFSLEGWMTIEKGDVASGDVWLKKGGASWQGDNEVHHLSVDNLTAHLSHDKQSWAFYIPDTRIAIDDKPPAKREPWRWRGSRRRTLVATIVSVAMSYVFAPAIWHSAA